MNCFSLTFICSKMIGLCMMNLFECAVPNHCQVLMKEHDEDDTLISPIRKRGQRAANYSSDEDVALIRAWESVSLDAIAGVDQSSSTFWSRISEHFHGNGNTTTTRTIGSLQHRWSTIQECCNKWKSCLAQVARQHPSGVPLQE